jgi:hypothetical protein
MRGIYPLDKDMGETPGKTTMIRHGLHIAKAIWKSSQDYEEYREDSDVHQQWNLQTALATEGVGFNTEGVDCNTEGVDFNTEKEGRELGTLAEMLRLRSLFLVALLMIGPDSSPIVEAWGSQAQVPII